ncbi:MAG: GDP-L-fucose synthase [Candidatus Liptonbacteria bacterium]|nr:GDP-L-fucose synthase [Candidatus Liptonbacteria bacterium]
MERIRLADKKILVTGGSGFLGSHLIHELTSRGVPGTNLFSPRMEEYDLTKKGSYGEAFQKFAPDIVIHAAAKVGGIGYNVKYPSAIFRDNVIMALNILDLSIEHKIQKLMIVGSACMYPGALTGNFEEKDLLAGPLHPTVEVYGFSKRALLLGARAYAREHGLNFSFAVPANLYGPRDTFDPDRSHVASALIRKFVDAREDGKREVVVWGTGAAVREFIFASDAAKAIVAITELGNYPEPLNVGTGVGTPIKELAETICAIVGFKGTIRWDASKPDGALHKVLNISKLMQATGWKPEVKLTDGLRETIEWYANNRKRLGY